MVLVWWGGPPGWDLVSVVIPRSWGGNHTSRLDDERFRYARDALEVRSLGREGKRLLHAPRGTLEMFDRRRGTFSKRATYVPDARYPLATNVAVYLGPASFMVELETMSPIVTLLRGRSCGTSSGQRGRRGDVHRRHAARSEGRRAPGGGDPS